MLKLGSNSSSEKQFCVRKSSSSLSLNSMITWKREATYWIIEHTDKNGQNNWTKKPKNAKQTSWGRHKTFLKIMSKSRFCKGLFTWRWGTLDRRGNPLRLSEEITSSTCNLTTPPSRGTLYQDYWMAAKHVDKKNAGKPRFLVINAILNSLAALAATFSAVDFCC